MIQTLKNRLRNERGDGLVVYVIMLIPVIIMFMGLAIDQNAINSTKSALQGSADSATQGTLALTDESASGDPHYASAAEAKAEFIRLYNKNSLGAAGSSQSHLPFLKCSAIEDVPAGGELINRATSAGNCPWVLKSFSYNGSNKNVSIKVSLSEKNKTILIGALNKDFADLNYEIQSDARLSYTREQ